MVRQLTTPETRHALSLHTNKTNAPLLYCARIGQRDPAAFRGINSAIDS